MASARANSMFNDGGSSNKSPLLSGEYFDLWKIRMKPHLEAQGDGIWEIVENGPHNPTSMVNGVGTPKIKSSYDEDDKKRILNDKKAINILQSALSMDEFFRKSQCKSAKEIWDTLVETHEGTVEVKRSRLNTLSQEYEMFIMQPGESIVALQKRFVHLTNHLIALGKTFTNDDLNLKVLRSLTREWQPKFTASSEKKSLSTMKKREAFTSTQEVTCYECGKQGHIKPDCLRLSKKGGFKGKKDFKNKKAYVAWEDNEISSSSESESDECANLALMASHHSDDEEDEVSSNFSLFDSDAQGDINELLVECKILYKTISSQKKTILSLEEKTVTIEKDVNDEKQKMISEKQNFVCKNCKFDEKSDEGIFLGYSLTSKAYRIYNKTTLKIEEYMHVTFYESNPSKDDIVLCDDDDDIVEVPQKDASSGNNDDQRKHQDEQDQQKTNDNDLPKE
ncbi:uncharacterized protein LOC127079286 [Lathyrus oleraceus]|uniref:uncharacterized protein LOC127079286 n=1 Tax=Pisum sativum TaxID=3888 RepID=UPI0021D2C4C7|nr:uncharacterized protein LOC127079286 [Pisum sativum]